ncbi:SIS domain-containing protein [Paraglaciecola sp.]|uniref:SIS domain-containing protein n=1 Tax=Paraglaciecola sp. TaxID=1920173 RepID=UPI00326657FD
MDKRFKKSLTEFIDDYPLLSENSGVLFDAFQVLLATTLKGGTIFTCGNGGSAADAEHIVGELMKSFAFQRPLPPSDHQKIINTLGEMGDELVNHLEGAIKAIALTEGIAFATAFANDVSYQYAFAQKLYGLCRQGDVLIALSTSGNSKNIVAAAQVAKSMGVKVILLTGQSGGELHQWADISIRVPAVKTHKIQELHLPIYHFLCFVLEQHIYGIENIKPVSDQITTPINPSANKLQNKLQYVSHIIFDFDGVLTDNKVWVNQEGIESVRCSRADGIGNQQLKLAKFKTMLLSTEANPVVCERAKKLDIPCVHNCSNKAEFIRKFLKDNHLQAQNIMFVGNDINDLEAMKLSGIRVCPNDSHIRIKAISDFVLPVAGGEGVMREVAQIFGVGE